jgi:hypothetical protein
LKDEVKEVEEVKEVKSGRIGLTEVAGAEHAAPLQSEKGDDDELDD